MPQKRRVEIPQDLAAEVLFRSDRTCCVCREKTKPIQLHHIDGDPSNSIGDNLAVLCLDCHRETQIRGGFDRKLDAAQVRRYKLDWVARIESQRSGGAATPDEEPLNSGQGLRYIQIQEESQEHSYHFSADYPLLLSSDKTSDSEVNSCINAFIVRKLQRFRIMSIETANHKKEMKDKGYGAAATDALGISHKVSLLSPTVLSIEFPLWTYGAGAAHPNHWTRTMNFRLSPSLELSTEEIFKINSGFRDILSRYCIDDLHRQKPTRWGDPPPRSIDPKNAPDDWICRGAGPDIGNFQKISISAHGLIVHFDPYEVGSYAEGKYEVFIPAYELSKVLHDEFKALMKWS